MPQVSAILILSAAGQSGNEIRKSRDVVGTGHRPNFDKRVIIPLYQVAPTHDWGLSNFTKQIGTH